MNNIMKIPEFFGLSEKIENIKKINSGHINATYKITFSGGASFILQRINRNVFKNPEKIMSNIDKICSCLKGRVNCPEFIKSNDKNYIIKDNSMWRIYRYIENSVCRNSLENDNEIFEFGRVTGEFHEITASLDINDFHEIIENFHSTVYIIENLICHKSSDYKKEFDFFEKALEYSKKLERKNLPKKVTHNDVKCSNVLFDMTNGKGITLIDFDTVMPGLQIYDFGDGARSACVNGNEFDTEKFRVYCNGYFTNCKPQQQEDYFLGLYCITAELAARYFKDFLFDENYFSDKSRQQKLERCRNLIMLSESILHNQEEIIEIIKDFV